MSNRCTICGAEVDYAEETAHRFVDHDPSPLTEDIVAYVRSSIAAELRAEWAEVCGGYQNLDACPECRVFDTAIRIAEGGAQ